ncbi:DinB family protein [Pedobacter foliorum]|uniref:DinB family protein n=1 Tax=Pedobacter foliorum TaxID=2739058 RepID=UPI001563BDB5|nr:DinB family protein [Pedobacter foliorum]NRF40532.1 DinB family protein [Pedobacter foliorum]
MKTETLNKVTETTDELLKLISSLSEEQLNKVPFEGSWTAGQVTDHISQSFGGIIETVNDKAVPTERDPGKKIDLIKGIFLDFTTKMTSPDFVLPSPPPHKKEVLVADLNTMKDQITEAIKTLDLTETHMNFEIPGFGKFTRLEWINFLIYHMQRHTHQIKNIQQLV